MDRYDIEQAAKRISGHVRVTPVIGMEGAAFGTPDQVALKLECMQRSGSFKARGAFNLLLGRDIPPAGVAAASGGNFGYAIAYAASVLGVRATIFVPTATSAAKVARIRATGAELVVGGDFYADALAASRAYVAETGAVFAHAYDMPEIVAGAGTCARELAEQRPDLDTVLVAVGGGGLIGGIAAWYAGGTKVVGVESLGTPTLASALQHGEPVDVEISGIAADALGARRIGDIGFAVAQKWVAEAILVDDESILVSQRALWDQARVAVEPAAAAPLAALMTGAYLPEPYERIGVVLCGANVDPASLAG